MGLSSSKLDRVAKAMVDGLEEQSLVRHRIVPTQIYGIDEISNELPAFTEEAVREYLECKQATSTLIVGNQFSSSSTIKQKEKRVTEALKRDFGVPEREATARIVLRLRPMIEPQVSENNTDELTARARERGRPWTTIDYCFNRANGEENLDVRGAGGLHNLLPDNARGLNGQGPLNNESTANLFLNSLRYFINNLEGTVWWNGFTMNLSGDPNTRLELIYHEMDPLGLIFKVKGLREIDMIRTIRRFELIGKSMTLGVEPRTLQITGPNVSMIKTMPPKDGMILLNFPTYNSNPNMDGN